MSNAFLMIAAALAVMLAGAALLQPAFAHGRFTMPVSDAPVQGRQVVMVIGHTNEPTFAVERGVHNGLHGLELSLSDFDTKMPLAGAQLKADKFYFKDIASFNAATSSSDADEVVSGVGVGGIFGSPGFYQIRQLVTEGIYGYRIYGTVDYFGVASIPVDVTAFCRSPEGNTTRFNSPGFAGGYGCVDDIDTLAFPEGALGSSASDGKAVVKVVAVGPEGKELGMFAKLRQGNKVVTQGFTPFFFQGKAGETYKVSMANFEGRVFDRWDDGSKSRDRVITLQEDATLTAHYTGATTNSTTSQQGKPQIAIPVAYDVASAQNLGTVQEQGSVDNNATTLMHLLGIALPVAAAAVFGARMYTKSKDGKT